MRRIRAAFATARWALRGADGRLLAIALLLVVVSMALIERLSARIQLGMTASVQDWLGAEAVLSGAEPALPDWITRLDAEALPWARLQILPSMLFSAEHSALAEVKAVDPHWPLRGGAITHPAVPGARPEPGSVWMAPELASRLQVQVGDQVDLGEISVRVAAVLVRDPERSGGPFSLAPRVIVSMQDLDASGLVGPGSRVNHRLLINGPAARVDAILQDLQSSLQGRAQVQRLADAQANLGQALERATTFLRLAVLCSVLLCGVAVLLAARGYAERESSTVALYRSLGWTRYALLARYASAVAMVALAAAAVGLPLAWMVEGVIVQLVRIPELTTLPAAPWWMGSRGVLLALLLLLGCVLPALDALCRVPPLAILKQDRARLPVLPWAVWVVPAGLTLLLAAHAAGSAHLAVWTLGGVGLLGGVLATLAWALLRVWPPPRPIWRGGLGRYRRAPALGVLQLLALSIGLAAIALVGVLSRDLLAAWDQRLQDDTPNHFLMNVRTDQRDDVLLALSQMGAIRVTHAPVAVARLRAINTVPVAELDAPLQDAERLQRNQNLSWSDAPGIGNRIVAGTWFSEDDIAEVSVASRWAEPLGVKLGDRLSLSVGEQLLEVTVSSLREVAWDTFAVNFFLVLEPAAAAHLPHAHLLSFHVPPAAKAQLEVLLRRYGNLTLIDLEATLAEVRLIIGQAALAVQWVFGLSLVAGVLVLVTVFHLSLRERLREVAILRALGASASALRRAVMLEHVQLAGMAGVLAIVLASGCGMLLARQVFGLELRPDAWALGLLWLIAVGIGAGLGALAGRRLLRGRALDAVRQV